jgi:tRNA (mo5U34)-methyltransferase
MEDLMDQVVQQRVMEIRWYHSMQLGDVVTPGQVDVGRQAWALQVMPDDLIDKAVLDVGAWDGYYSFEAERRGAARVVAIDSLIGWHGDVGTTGFECARAFYRSRVEFKVMSVMEVDGLDEQFDLVLFLGVYYHLGDPERALRLLFDRLRPGGAIAIEGAVVAGTLPELVTVPPVDVRSTEYYARKLPTVPWLECVLRDIGFADIDVVDGTWNARSSLVHNATRYPGMLMRAAIAAGNQVMWSTRLRVVPWMRRKQLKTFRVLVRARKP